MDGQQDPLGILTDDKKKKQSDPLGILKKKDGGESPFDKFGIRVSPATSPIPSRGQSKKEPQSDINDPVGNMVNEPERRFGEALSNINKFGAEGRAVSESTGQGIKTPLGTESYQTTLKKDFDKAQTDVNDAMERAYNSFFPSPIGARDYLKKMVETHGVEKIKDNKTAQLAADKVVKYENLKQRIAQNPNLRQVAVDIARENDPNLDRQILVLEGGKEDDRGLDLYENVIPQSMQGAIVDRFINDRNIKALATEDPNIAAQLQELGNGNIYKIYPEYGETVAKNILSREYAKKRANRFANPIFNKSQYLDKLSDETFADNPALKEIADTRLKGNWKGKIDTPGLVDEFGIGATHAFAGMGQSFKDLLGAGKSERERIEEGLQQQYGGVYHGVGGSWQKVLDASSFGGMIAAMAATGAPLRGAGMNPATASKVVTGGTFFDDELNKATMKFPGEPGKAALEAITMTALYSAAGNALPSKKVAELVSKARPEVSDAIKALSAEAVETEMKLATVKAVQNALTGVGKGTAEMTILTGINNSLDRALGVDGETHMKYHPDSELQEVAEGMLIGLAAPNILSAIKNRRATTNKIYEIASFPDRYASILSKGDMTPDLQKQLENIQFLSETKKALDEQGVSESNQKQHLLNALNRKYAVERLTASPEASIKRKIEGEIKRYDEQNDRILQGEDVAAELEKKEPEDKIEIEADEISKPIELSTELPEGYTLPEQPVREPEVNLPKAEVTEPAPTEPEQPAQAAPGATSKEVIEPYSGDPKMVGISHARMDAIAKELGLETYQKDPEKVSTWDEEADKRLREDPETLPKLFDKLRKGDMPDKIDNRVMIKYLADLYAKIENAPSPKLLDQLKRTRDLFNIAGREWGKAGVARQGAIPAEDTLGNFLLDRGGDKGRPLSEKQIETETQRYNELKAAKEKLEIQLEEERGQYARMAAEYGVNKAKAMAKKASKKTHEERVAERKQAIDAAKEALRKLRGEASATIIPGARELAAIAPHVKKVMESLVGEGIDKLDNLVTAIHAEFKDILEGVTPNQIREIIGGEYDSKGQTKAQKANQLRLLQREASLLTELDKARKGLEKEKTERGQDAKTRRIIELEEKIKDVRRLNKENVADEGVVDRSVAGEAPIDVEGKYDKAYQERLTKKIDKLQKDIRDKKYEPEPKPEVKFAKSAKTLELEDKVINLEKRLAMDKVKDKLAKRTKSEKIYDFATREILGVKRIAQTILDFSIWARQTVRLALNPRKWDIFGKEVAKSWQSAWSQKKFDRYMNEIHKDPQFAEMEKDGIKFNEFESHEVDKENEFYQKNWLFKVPVLKHLFLGSQRVADSALNVARYELYKRYANNLRDAGISRESDPKIYEWMASEVMNQTGRGKLFKGAENNANFQKILGNTFYGARLMASNFNQLNPAYYVKMPKEVRQMIWKDIASYVVTTMATGAGLMAAGGKVSFDPDDSDFLQVRFGDKVYDITGGKAQYIRTALRIANSVYASGATMVGAKPKSETRKSQKMAFESTLRFFRNKLAPNTGLALNAIFPQKDYGGREVGLKELLEFYPMYADDLVKAFEDEGFLSLATTLIPNLIGVGYNQYFNDPAQQSIDDLLERNVKSDEMDLSTYKNYKEGGRPITKDEERLFIKKRDELIETELKKMHSGSIPIIENEDVVYKKFKELTKDQIISETSRIKAEATRKVKEEMFGKEKKTKKQRIAERKLQRERQKNK